MIEAIRVETKTPRNQCKSYIFFGDLDDEKDQARLIEFMLQCCDETAEFYPYPEGWNEEEWKNSTQAMWTDVEDKRDTFGPSGLSTFLKEGF